MGYQEELARLQEAKASMRQSIINKGVDVPEDAKIEEYPDYIAQIIAGSEIPDAPDLTKVLTAQDLADIQAIVAARKASEKFQLGQTLLITYGTYTMPFEIVGFEDVEVEGGETVPAINLLSKYVSDTTPKWGASASTTYSASTLRSAVVGAYQNALDSNFVNCLGKTKVQRVNRNGTTNTVYDKLFVPSMAQLGVTNSTFNTATQAAIEGPAFTTFQDAADAKRVKTAINLTGTALNYWTSSFALSNAQYSGIIQPAGTPGIGYFDGTFRFVVACNFVG